MINGKNKKKLNFVHLSWAECDKIDNEVINKVVSRMETMLQIPEAVLVKQDDLPEDEDKLFYLIAKGRCQVEVTDKFKDR